MWRRSPPPLPNPSNQAVSSHLSGRSSRHQGCRKELVPDHDLRQRLHRVWELLQVAWCDPVIVSVSSSSWLGKKANLSILASVSFSVLNEHEFCAMEKPPCWVLPQVSVKIISLSRRMDLVCLCSMGATDGFRTPGPLFPN